jgi:hypothetical protein
MNSSALKNINQAQKDYLKLIDHYKNIVDNDELNFKKVSMLIDDVKCFWLERLNIIEFEIEDLTENNLCFLLSGAIYLDVSSYEQYYFKSFGDYHLLFDPFLKLEAFFRIDENKINSKETLDYFRKVYYDTINILTNYRNIFLILPIRKIAIEDNKKHHEMLNKIFLNVVSDLFNTEFKTEEDFCNKFRSLEEIEDNMGPNKNCYLVFSDHDNPELSLRKKIENYSETQMSISSLLKNKTEPQIFLIVVNSWISQIIDILLICISLRLYPYIRFSVTFHYLILIMHSFTEDKSLKEMIEKTIIFYIFTRSINKDRFKNVEFTEYCNRIKDKNILSDLIDKIHAQGINIFKGGIKQTESIILDEYSLIL